MLSRIFGVRLELNKDYEVEVLKEMEQLAKSVSTVWISVAIGLIIFTITMIMLKRKEGLYITSIIYAISAMLLLSSNFLYSLNRPVEVENVKALIEGVEVGEYKGVHFLRNAESAKDVQEDILYLTIESVFRENFENVIGKEETITIRQEIDKFKEKGIYQAILVNEGSPDEHMLLIELVGDGTVIKLDDYQNIENQKRYIVEQMEKEFISLKKEDLQ